MLNRLLGFILIPLLALISALLFPSASYSAPPGFVLPFPEPKEFLCCSEYHKDEDAEAVDYDVKNEPVHASKTGKVVFAEWAAKGKGTYGWTIVLLHDDNFISLYAHLGEIRVKVGDFVQQGSRIGTSGESGTKRPHLHFVIRHIPNLTAGSDGRYNSDVLLYTGRSQPITDLKPGPKEIYWEVKPAADSLQQTSRKPEQTEKPLLQRAIEQASDWVRRAVGAAGNVFRKLVSPVRGAEPSPETQPPEQRRSQPSREAVVPGAPSQLQPPPGAQPAFPDTQQPRQPVRPQGPACVAAPGWSKGSIVGLRRGAQIWQGEGRKGKLIVVPDNAEQPWNVMVKDGPRCVNDEDWYDIDRKAAGDPSGGSGWVNRSQAQYSGGTPSSSGSVPPGYSGPEAPDYAPSFPGQTVSWKGNNFVSSSDGRTWIFQGSDAERAERERLRKQQELRELEEKAKDQGVYLQKANLSARYTESGIHPAGGGLADAEYVVINGPYRARVNPDATLRAPWTQWFEEPGRYRMTTRTERIQVEILALPTPTPTPTSIPVPNAPSNLRVANRAQNGFTLSWQDNSWNEDGFRVYFLGLDWIPIAELPPNSNTFVESSLSCNTGQPYEVFWYRVTAYHRSGESFPTNTVEATSQPCFPPTPTPTPTQRQIVTPIPTFTPTPTQTPSPTPTVSPTPTPTSTFTPTPPPSEPYGCDGAVALWRFDGNGNDGCLRGHNASTSGSYASGQFGRQALVFNVSTASAADSPDFNLSSFTLEGYIRCDRPCDEGGPGHYNRMTIIRRNGTRPGQEAYYLGLAGKLEFQIDGNPLFGNTTLSGSTWYHVKATYDGAKMRVYVNSTLDGQRDYSIPTPSSSGPLFMGNNRVNYDYFEGRMQYVRISNFAR